MSDFASTLRNVFLFTDGGLGEIIVRSLQVSLIAVLIGAALGIPCGFYLGLANSRGKSLMIKGVYAGMGLPPVFVGLVVFLLLSRSGLIGRHVYVLFTPVAMIIAQVILAFPIITGLTVGAVESSSREIIQTAQGLGARGFQIYLTLLSELRFPLITAVVTAFGRAIAEVGAVSLVGGDIAGHTRMMTTAIVLETRKGNFNNAITLGVVLLTISLIVNSLLYKWQHRR